MKRAFQIAVLLAVPSLLMAASGTTVRVLASETNSADQKVLASAFEAAVRQSGKDIRLPATPSEKAQVEIRVQSIVRHGNTDEVDCEARQGEATLPIHLSYDATKREAYLTDLVQKTLPLMLADLAKKSGPAK